MGQFALATVNPSELLDHARAELLSEIGRQSRYTCAQNIQRDFYFYAVDSTAHHTCSDVDAGRKRSRTLIWSDRLELDVAIADNREIHSWPGASRFDEDEVRELVSKGGPFGSGDFGAFIDGIFGGSATVKYVNSTTVGGRLIFEYAFDVPQNLSNYAIADPAGTITTAYSGSFLLDARTADLLRLTVRTAQLPDANAACQATTEIQYQKIPVHGQEVLVPEKTQLRTVFRDGTETVGVTSYSNCHEYAGHAVLRFDDPESGTAGGLSSQHSSSKTATPTSSVPEGVTLQCRMLAPIDVKMPAGRSIEAVLRAPLRDNNGAILAPEGTRLRARVVRLAGYRSPQRYFEADIRLETIKLNGAEVPLYAVPVNVAQDTRKNRFSDFTGTAPRNVSAFFFEKSNNVRLPDSDWLTSHPEPEIGKAKPLQAKSSEVPQAAESRAVRNFALAVQYEQAAADLINKSGTTNIEANPELPVILTYRRKAIEIGKAADRDRLNDIYPDLGEKFQSLFLGALTLFVHSQETGSPTATAKKELSRSTLLYDEWVNWYEPLRKDIDAAIQSSAADVPRVDPQ